MITLKLVLPLGCLVTSSAALPFTSSESDTYSANINSYNQLSCAQLIKDYTSLASRLPPCVCDMYKKQGRGALYEYCNKNGIQVPNSILDQSLDACGGTWDDTKAVDLTQSIPCVGPLDSCSDFSGSREASTRGGKDLSVILGSEGSSNDDLRTGIDSVLDGVSGEDLSATTKLGNNKIWEDMVDNNELDQVGSKALGKVQGIDRGTSTELVNTGSLEDIVDNNELGHVGSKVLDKDRGTSTGLVDAGSLEDLVRDKGFGQAYSVILNTIQGQDRGTTIKLGDNKNLEDTVENSEPDPIGSKALDQVQGKDRGTSTEVVNAGNSDGLVRNKELGQADSVVLDKVQGQDHGEDLESDPSKSCVKDIEVGQGKTRANVAESDRSCAKVIEVDQGKTRAKVSEGAQGQDRSKDQVEDPANTQDKARIKELN